MGGICRVHMLCRGACIAQVSFVRRFARMRRCRREEKTDADAMQLGAGSLHRLTTAQDSVRRK